MKSIFTTILLSLIVGATAAVTATIYTENYLSRYSASLQEAGDRVLILSQQKPEPVPGTFEEAVENARESLQPALALFYPSVSTLMPSAAVGAGVVVTSDGWIVTVKEAVPSGSQVVVGTTVYAIKQMIPDTLTNAVMVKIEASGLPVIPFGAADEVDGGDLAFVVTGANGMIPTAIADARHSTMAKASNPAETFTTNFTLTDQVILPGSPVANSAGQLIALSIPFSQGDAGGVGALPLHHVLASIKSVIRSGEVQRVDFGATVTDLSLVHIADTLRRGFTRGDLVDQVTVSGPAALAGLQKGDIITHVGDMTLNDHTTLAELLAQYKPGDKVRVVVDRDGTEMTFEVQLGK